MDSIIAELQLGPIISSVIYSLIGIVIFILAIVVIEILTPFSIKKEIEQDQNVALGIILGSIIIALALIIASAIQ